MPRNMILVRGNCACCGAEQIMELNEYSFVPDSTLTLQGYFDYIFVNSNTCSECGYSNDNILALVGEKTKEIVDSNEYQKVLDNGFMDGYKDLAPEYYTRFSGGSFDAMSVLYEQNGVENLTYAKIQNRIFNIKSSIRSYIFENWCESSDEVLNKKYDELIKKLSTEMQLACKKGIKALTNLNSDNPYEQLFLAQLYTQIEQYEPARNLVERVRQNYKFDDELEDYIKEFLSEIERV